jgi:hypothetical protein
LGALIGNYSRYLEEINIREDKLLLYHCLLELGSPKVNVSEHIQYCYSRLLVSSCCTTKMKRLKICCLFLIVMLKRGKAEKKEVNFCVFVLHAPDCCASEPGFESGMDPEEWAAVQ